MTYQRPSGRPGFGDLLAADWFHSAYLRRDALSLEVGPTASGQRQSWVQAAPASGRDLLLAHGRPLPVVLLSDPCEIESVLEHRGGGRLLVAGITPWDSQATEWQKQGRQRDFRRHLLPPADGYRGGVVQFGALYLVVDKCIQEANREWALERRAQINLEVAWEAYAVRRGPRAVADNARKLAALITADGDEVVAEDVMEGRAPESDEATRARVAVDEALEVAWDMEGADLNDVSDTLELGVRGSISAAEFKVQSAARRSHLRDAFLRLAAASTVAAEALAPPSASADATSVSA